MPPIVWHVLGTYFFANMGGGGGQNDFIDWSHGVVFLDISSGEPLLGSIEAQKSHRQLQCTFFGTG